MDFNNIKEIADVIEERVILIQRGSTCTSADKQRRGA